MQVEMSDAAEAYHIYITKLETNIPTNKNEMGKYIEEEGIKKTKRSRVKQNRKNNNTNILVQIFFEEKRENSKKTCE